MAKKVLFINRANQASFIPDLLKDAGYEAIPVNDIWANAFATSGAGAALNHLESQPYDMVILMENASAESWKLCAEIRRRTASPLIVISSGASAEACVKAISSGADFFMRKPFGPMELISRVNALFQRSNTLQPIPIVS
jgi:DNA-binding response OmpR family regulator